jgi:hypothetical protein
LKFAVKSGADSKPTETELLGQALGYNARAVDSTTSRRMKDRIKEQPTFLITSVATAFCCRNDQTKVKAAELNLWESRHWTDFPQFGIWLL